MRLDLTNEELAPIVDRAVRELVERELGVAIREQAREIARKFMRWATPKKAARLSGLDERTLRDWVKAGKLTKSTGFGPREPRISLDDLAEKIADKQIKSVATLTRERGGKLKIAA